MNRSAQPRPDLLCTLSPGGSGTPLFLVPSVGCTPLSLVRLARSISPRRPVHAFAYAGMEDDAPPHRTLEAMGAACIADLVAVAPHGPYVLGGHCFGGVVALEIALQLEARGAVVARLVVLDSIAPRLADAGCVPAGPAGGGESASVLEGHVRHVLEELAARAVSHSPLIDPELSRRLGAVLRLHIDAGVAYRARPLRAGVDVLRTEGCPAAALEGWTTIAAGGVVQRQIPGDTFSMLQQPHVESVGRSLGSALQDADR